MTTLYLVSSPRPRMTATDAVLQEAETLEGHFGGVVRHLFPFTSPMLRFPLSLYGAHLLPTLSSPAHDRLHLFHSDLHDFPALRVSRRPLIYTVTVGVDVGRLPRPELASRLAHVAVPTEADRDRILDWGRRRAGREVPVSVVVPGVDRQRFRPIEPPPSPTGSRGSEIVLLAGSAPWTEAQFRSKGFDALLEAARDLPQLRLVLLWRGFLRRSLHERLRRMGLEERVEVIGERVDVAVLLARVHAAVVLAERRELVRAYPHSLLEALSCGRPVVCSDTIALSRFVERNRCGLVVPGLDPGSLRAAVTGLCRDYDRYREGALAIGPEVFSATSMIAAYERIYRG